MLSFDEFSAVSERGRTKNASDDSKKDKAEASEKPKSQSVDVGSNFGLGDFLEMHEMQAVVFCLVLIDSFAAFAEVSAATLEGSGDQSQREADLQELTLKLLRAFTSFTVFFFALELLALLLAFGFKFIGHIGYLIDSIVVAIQLYFAVTGGGLQCRVLNIFRFWRLLRLFQSMLNVEREAHENTKRNMETLQLKRQGLESRVKICQDDLKKEQEARASVEEMLQTYKDEVDTLNEALKIAAMDIAEVAEAEDEYFLSEEEEEGEEDDDALSVSAASESVSFASAAEATGGSATGERSHKETLYREALRDSSAAGAQSAAALGQQTTFVVREDGTFEKK